MSWMEHSDRISKCSCENWATFISKSKFRHNWELYANLISLNTLIEGDAFRDFLLRTPYVVVKTKSQSHSGIFYSGAFRDFLLRKVVCSDFF